MTPLIGSLFSGYGGLDLAVQRVHGGEVVWYSEIDKHACTVLAAHHPGVPNLGDITAVDWATVPPIDILTGGYPCQPFSHAGQRKGTNDERHLWPYVRDAIVALRPMVTVLENVDGHRSLGLDVVLGDLADLGMSARWGVVRAADAGAPHGRKRVFIVVEDPARGLGRAGQGWCLRESEGPAGLAASDCDGPAADASGEGPQGCSLPAKALHRTRSGGAGADGGPEPFVNASGASGEQRRRYEGSRETESGGSDRGAAADAEGWRRGAGQGLAATAVGRGQQGVGDSGGAAAADAASTGAGSDEHGIRQERIRGHHGATTDWGRYAPAIRRWESVLGRPAPAPTVPGANGRPRLSPYLVEWMMGLEPGHVTGHGLKPAACLKMLGNGVVPQQAELALRMLAVADA